MNKSDSIYNIGGIAGIEIALAVSVVIEQSGERWALSAGDFEAIPHVTESDTYEVNGEISENGTLYSHQLNFFHAVLRPEATAIFQAYSDVPVVLRLSRQDGEKVLLGTPGYPATLRFSPNNGQLGANGTGYAVSVTALTDLAEYYLQP